MVRSMNISNLGTRSDRKSFERLKSSSISNSVRYRTCHHTACKARQDFLLNLRKFSSPRLWEEISEQRNKHQRGKTRKKQSFESRSSCSSLQNTERERDMFEEISALREREREREREMVLETNWRRRRRRRTWELFFLSLSKRRSKAMRTLASDARTMALKS